LKSGNYLEAHSFCVLNCHILAARIIKNCLGLQRPGQAAAWEAEAGRKVLPRTVGRHSQFLLNGTSVQDH
jgi:hypothetical protein